MTQQLIKSGNGVEFDVPMAIQIAGDPNRLEVYVLASGDDRGGVDNPGGEMPGARVGGAVDRGPVLSEPLMEGLTAVTVTPHGLAFADRQGRVHLRAIDLLDALSASRETASRQSLWSGSMVHAMYWSACGGLLTGDDHGRLLRWNTGQGEGADAPPALIATATKKWVAILPDGQDGALAVAADGRWVSVDATGQINRDGALPLPGSDLTLQRALFCRASQTLVYAACSTAFDDVGHEIPYATTEVKRIWSALNLNDGRPVALPQVIRYADTIVADANTLWAMNRQGISWSWGIGDEQPFELRGWPTGPCLDPLLIEAYPTVARLGTDGQVDFLTIQSRVWTAQDPERFSSRMTSGIRRRGRMSRVWAGYAEVFKKSRQARRTERITDLQRRALTAHTRSDLADREDALNQMQSISAATRRVHALRTRFAVDAGDPLAALEHCREVITLSGGALPPVWCEQYLRLLWQTAALDELQVLRGYLRVVPAECSDYASDAHAFDNTLIDTCADHQARDAATAAMAWDRVRRWGTAGPYWIGSEHEPPVHLSDSDKQQLGLALIACGAEAIDAFAILPCTSVEPAAGSISSIGGTRVPSAGWVFSEPIANAPMQRQLVCWQLPGAGAPLACCWAIRSDRFASPDAWKVAAQAVKDPVWRSYCRRRFELALQAVACGVTPDTSMFVESPGVLATEQELSS